MHGHMAVWWIIAEARQGIFGGEMYPRHGEWDNGECGHGSTLLLCLDMMMLPQNVIMMDRTGTVRIAMKKTLRCIHARIL